MGFISSIQTVFEVDLHMISFINEKFQHKNKSIEMWKVTPTSSENIAQSSKSNDFKRRNIKKSPKKL